MLQKIKSNTFLTFLTGLMVLLSSHAYAAKMSKFQVAQHVSPMPNLMMLVQTNAAQLELDNDQLQQVAHWRHQNHHKSKQLMHKIMELEKEIKESALYGIEKEDLDELKNDLLQARSDLIDLKHRCVTTMQSLLEEPQWDQLMEIRERQLRAMTAGSNTKNEIQSFLLASPMPKFMAIILLHGDELAMSPDQKQALEKWRLKNMNHWALLFDKVLNAEKKLTADALEMVDGKELLATYMDVLAKREEMATMSLACRDNMRKVLDDKQWAHVVKLFKSYQ